MTTPPPPSNNNNNTYPDLSSDVLCKLSTQPPNTFVKMSFGDLFRIEQACVNAAKQGEGRCTIQLTNAGTKQKEYCNYITTILSERGLESGALDKASYIDPESDPNYHKLVVIWKK